MRQVPQAVELAERVGERSAERQLRLDLDQEALGDSLGDDVDLPPAVAVTAPDIRFDGPNPGR